MTLFIDTHNEMAKVVIFCDGKILTKKEKKSVGHSNNIMPMIDEAFKENNLNIKNLKEIIVVNGPGSFTGVRIGVTIAKTIAYATKCNIKTVDSLSLKSISSNLNKAFCVEKDPNGYYCGLFQDKKLISEMFYLSNSEYTEFIKENDYEDIIVDDIKLDYEGIYNYMKMIEAINSHEVKPLYIKKIAVLND